MSVFGDFQRVWVQRFPESSLSAAWEEDVRASLDKHKQKVISLREELEKEELYIEYLERLLNDVEELRLNKETALQNASAPPQANEKNNVDKGPDIIQGTQKNPQQIAVREAEGDGEKAAAAFDKQQPPEQAKDEEAVLLRERRRRSQVHQCVAELSAATRRCVSEVRSGTTATSASEQDASNFVTVIEVNQQQKQNGKEQTQSKPLKVAPRPPPKAFHKIGNSLEQDDVSPTCSLGKTGSSCSSHSRPSSRASISDRVKSYESICSRDSGKSGPSPSEGGSRSLESGTGTAEPYYDSVPIDGQEDGEYVYIQAGGSSSSRDDVSPQANSPCDTLPLTGQSPGNSLTNVLVEPESPGKNSNYVNIDYFIQNSSRQRSGTMETRGSSVDSDNETDVMLAPPLLRAFSTDVDQHNEPEDPPPYTSVILDTSGQTRKLSGVLDVSQQEAERVSMYRCIIESIIKGEKVYVEWLTVMMQYMKAIKATLKTSQPVITEDEFDTMFYKVPELHSLHSSFLEGLQLRIQNWDGKLTIGDHFKIMASNINIYGAFLHNYGRAKDTVRKCCGNNSHFAQVTSEIRLQSQREHSLSLEDLLHKPVNRVQMNALVLHDLLKYTPASHPDHLTLSEALNMTQHFLDEFNMIQTKNMFPSADRAQRRLVKNSFIVELAEGCRKLRHLFLFNDVIACAKYKASGREKFTFELKWYIPLSDILIFEEPAIDPKESSPANIVSLKSQACNVRDQLLLEDKEDKKSRLGNRSEKQKKKLADLEAQLVLASPNLVFRVGNKQTSRAQTFFLSSDFERTQWIESIQQLQQSSQLPGPVITPSMYELQAWITACRTFLKTNMGSYLMRSGRDESLLVGDLHLTIKDLTGLDYAADLFVCIEVDSYGHYFRKAKSKLVCRSTNPAWNETYVLELEGSQNMRLLLYEENQTRPILRAKHTLKLSRSWLQETWLTQSIVLRNCTLNVLLKFTPSEVTLRRVPTSKPGALFGAKILQVCKREKRDVPFIVTSSVREVERRGMTEVGIYRVSGSATDLNRLKKSFESNPYEAEQLLKEVDIHSVTGILKLYLREMPEALFTDALYAKFAEAFNLGSTANSNRTVALSHCYESLPLQNKECIDYLLNHLIKVNRHEQENKMSLHNLATVFGPTLLRPGARSETKQKDRLAESTVDVMTQAGILYCFLQQKSEQLRVEGTNKSNH